MKCTSLLCLLLAACATTDLERPASGPARPVSIEIEGGALRQSRNVVRIPGDTGTRFSMQDLTGSGPFANARLTADWDLDSSHALRAVYAPLEFSGTGRLDAATLFDGTLFQAGVPTKGSYKFSSYRLGYRYTFLQDDTWRLRVGGTLFVRDAEIKLEQADRRASDSDVGVVPLLNASAEYRAADRWRFVGEFDGLASPQGRAFDIALKGFYDVSDDLSLGLGYRTIEGGADNDNVYNFAWFQSLVFSAAYRF